MSEERIAVIGGTGDLGLGLALRWALAGVPVLIGSREAAKAEAAAQKVIGQLTGKARGGAAGNISVAGFENARAVEQASVVVLAVPFPAQAGILKSIRGALQSSAHNQILVDSTVPLAATLGGKPTRMLGVWEGSAAEQARELAPSKVPVLAALHSVSAEGLQDLDAQLDCDVLVCGDDAAAKQRFFPLVRLIQGLRPVDAGPLEMARIAESLTALLISVNKQYKVKHSGIRITGIRSAE